MAVRYPTTFAYWLQAADFALGPVYEAAFVGHREDQRSQALQSALWSAWRPRMVAAMAEVPPAAGSPQLLEDRPLVDGQPAAYICQNFICQRPVTTPEELLKILDSTANN
jgi:uncharacterized protein YyaL (SSP411 family)